MCFFLAQGRRTHVCFFFCVSNTLSHTHTHTPVLPVFWVESDKSGGHREAFGLDPVCEPYHRVFVVLGGGAQQFLRQLLADQQRASDRKADADGDPAVWSGNNMERGVI